MPKGPQETQDKSKAAPQKLSKKQQKEKELAELQQIIQELGRKFRSSIFL